MLSSVPLLHRRSVVRKTSVAIGALALTAALAVAADSAGAAPTGPAASLPSRVTAAPGSHARIIDIADQAFAGSSINVVAGQQNTLFTDRSRQYAAYYDAGGFLNLAERNLGEDRWRHQTTKHKANVNDAHNTVALVADGAGFVHVAWDHHNGPLHYARSSGPGSTNLGDPQAMTGKHEDKVTYPQFLRLPDGDLLFFYRDGQSGRGNLVLNHYATKTQTWTQLHANLIDGEDQRSAYPTAVVDRRGVVHLAWNWRDSPDVATNHDLCYARSEDGGKTWKTTSGAALAVPFTAATAEYALRLPQKRSLMNPPTLALDGSGRPVIANYWCPEGSEVPQYHLVRFDGKNWNVQQVTQRTTKFTLGGMGTKNPPISRSVLLSRKPWQKPQEFHLVYRDDDRGGRIVMTSSLNADAPDATWTTRELTTESVGAWEPSLDPAQAARLGQLHLLVQPVVQRDGNDREAAAVKPTTLSSLLWSPFLDAMLAGTAAHAERTDGLQRLPVPPAETEAALKPAAVLATLERVAAWQLAQEYPKNRDVRGWEIAPFYLGVLEVAERSPSPRFHDELMKRFDAMKWEPAKRLYHADDHCVIQAYVRLWRKHHDPKMIAPGKARFDEILAKRPTEPIEWGFAYSDDRWSWCDALFMGPSAWLLMAEATGDKRYADFAHEEWEATTVALAHGEEKWYARDESFLDLREPNGKPLFWARGNGWVVAGLSNVLEILPANDPKRDGYLNQYRALMRAALLAQQVDGLWRPGLLDANTHDARETSGSSFMTFALARGVNSGWLEGVDRERAERAVKRAWPALIACVTPEGKLEHVQPIGAAPEGFDPHHNDWFGAGAFLLAGSEVHRMVTAPTATAQ